MIWRFTSRLTKVLDGIMHPRSMVPCSPSVLSVKENNLFALSPSSPCFDLADLIGRNSHKIECEAVEILTDAFRRKGNVGGVEQQLVSVQCDESGATGRRLQGFRQKIETNLCYFRLLPPSVPGVVGAGERPCGNTDGGTQPARHSVHPASLPRLLPTDNTIPTSRLPSSWQHS